MSDDNVINLNDRKRESKDQDKGYFCCWKCDGAYFWVETVTLESNGGAGGYSGFPVCINCGSVQSDPKVFPQDIPMPCGNCGETLVMPKDKEHNCFEEGES